MRKKAEKEADEKGLNIPFPGYDALDAENAEQPAMVWITIRDAQGNVIRHLKQKASKGTHRLAWDLRHASTGAIDPERTSSGGWFSRGPIAVPGTYSATLALEKDGEVSSMGEAVSFEVKPIREGVLKGMDYQQYNTYREALAALQTKLEMLRDGFDQAETALKGFQKALVRTPGSPVSLVADVSELEKAIRRLKLKTEGSPARDEIGERNPPSIQTHFSTAYRGMSTTYGPTALHRRSLSIAREMLAEVEPEVNRITGQMIPALTKKFRDAGAPYIKGQD
jgi:hypothetical protein